MVASVLADPYQYSLGARCGVECIGMMVAVSLKWLEWWRTACDCAPMIISSRFRHTAPCPCPAVSQIFLGDSSVANMLLAKTKVGAEGIRVGWGLVMLPGSGQLGLAGGLPWVPTANTRTCPISFRVTATDGASCPLASVSPLAFPP